MGREVDIKALVSHIIKGDGADKCRICMGDTSDGQVYLGDTVMMDGERPVTLSELLENITGIEVLTEEGLPAGLCSTCTEAAINAAEFRSFCHHATERWNTTIQLLGNLPESTIDSDNTSVFAILDNDQMIIINNLNQEIKKETTVQDKQVLREQNIFKQDYKTRRYKYNKAHSFECPDCCKPFVYALNLYNHLRESLVKRACFICGEVMSRDELVCHLQDIHEMNPCACNKCPAIFRSLEQYWKHCSKAHSPGALTCGDCGRSFKNEHAFSPHLAVHTLKSCPSCDQQFRNQPCYRYHVNKCCNLSIKNEDTCYQRNRVVIEVKNEITEKKIKVGLRGSAEKECYCDYCNKKFAAKKFVAAHIQIVHMKNTHRPCQYCGKFLAAAHMTEHIKRHEKLESFTCEYCGVILKSKLGYKQHIRLHTGEKPYACKLCGETFSASSRRSEHIRKMHKNKSELILKQVCQFCPAKFRLPYLLKKHLAAVHNNENGTQLQFECKICYEKFGSCRALLHHTRTHSQESMTVVKHKKNVNFKVYSEPTKGDEAD